MYGDPVSAPSLSATFAGNDQHHRIPGCLRAWQQASQLGTTGSYGWFLSCNDTGFPALSNGITVEGWFNYNFGGSSPGVPVTISSTATFNYAAAACRLR